MSGDMDSRIIADLPIAVAAQLIDEGYAELSSPVRDAGVGQILESVIVVLGATGSLVSVAQAPETIQAIAVALSSWWSRRRSKAGVAVELTVRSSRMRFEINGHVDPQVLAEFLRKSL